MKKFRLSLTLCHGLLVGGQTSGLLVDSATARESCGAPMIPASAVKGALRIEFERFIAGLGRNVCHPDRPENACNPDNPCIACRLFGAPGNEGNLRFSDALLKGVCRKWFTDEKRREIYDRKPTGRGYIIRQGITINRMRKVAEEKMLFNMETLGPLPVSADESESQLLFVSRIEASSPLEKEELELLQAAALSLASIGANKSRGMGHVHASLESVETSVSSAKPSSSQAGTDFRIVLVADEYIRVSGIKTSNNFLETTEYIPGSAVRGAVATSFAGACGGWNALAVREAFLKNPVQFSNFYPSTIKVNVQPKPIPISARTCKDYPGFQKHRKKYETQESHGAKDTLIAATIVKLLREFGMPAVLKVRCSDSLSGNLVCGAVLKGLNGFYQFPFSDKQTRENLRRRITTKTAINRARFTSAEEQLYSYESIDTRLESSDKKNSKDSRRLRFIGTIRGLTDELYQHIAKVERLLVGGARSRGFGRVRIEEIVDDSQESEDDLKDRLSQFTKKIQEPLRSASHPRRERLFFSLTCISDLMPLPAIRSGNFLDWLKQALELSLGLSGKDLRIENTIAQTGYRSGFNQALGIQKDLRGVIVRGSAFVFSCNAEGQESQTIILKNMQNLLRVGLGLQREEGFGRLSFCDRFHLERIEQQ